MDLQDVLFIVLVVLVALDLIGRDSGGGRRGRVPVVYARGRVNIGFYVSTTRLRMAEVIVIGGGLAGLASAAALAGAGHAVRVLESRRFLGGRATSYEIGTGENAETIDNCQHILLRCCVNLLDFYRRLGVENQIAFHREITFIEPGGRRSGLHAGLLPAPAHFAESFLSLKLLG